MTSKCNEESWMGSWDRKIPVSENGRNPNGVWILVNNNVAILAHQL